MKCTVCRHGETRPGTVSVVLERQGSTLVFRHVPALVCDNCGEPYHDEVVSEALLQKAEEAVRAGVEIAIRSYAPDGRRF
ncbi:MAG: type II toxin-antitoxin system MqsA family antitoxin [Magnetococcales bacterium]|nr:type II toxin-antitoxin system MqsA family antitoxin [Magnetococcales bacterium]